MTPAYKAPNGKWTADSIKFALSKCKTVSEVIEKHNGAYQTALRSGWWETICKDLNLKYLGGGSQLEKKVLAKIQDIYPTAKSKWFYPVTENSLGPVRLQLDIFIPEICKGIEVNGNYWHSNGFRPRSFATTPSEYHNAKKLFMRQHGVEYVELWESELIKDFDLTVSGAIDFLRKP